MCVYICIEMYKCSIYVYIAHVRRKGMYVCIHVHINVNIYTYVYIYMNILFSRDIL